MLLFENWDNKNKIIKKIREREIEFGVDTSLIMCLEMQVQKI